MPSDPPAETIPSARLRCASGTDRAAAERFRLAAVHESAMPSSGPVPSVSHSGPVANTAHNMPAAYSTAPVMETLRNP